MHQNFFYLVFLFPQYLHHCTYAYGNQGLLGCLFAYCGINVVDVMLEIALPVSIKATYANNNDLLSN